MATPNAAMHRDLEQRLRDLEASVRGLGSLAMGRKISPVFAMSDQQSDSSMDFTDPWSYYDSPTLITVPAGYHKVHIIMAVSAGQSYPAGDVGNVSVAPYIQWTGQTRVVGDPINSGNASVVVANAFWAPTNDSVGSETALTSFRLGVAANRSATAPIAGSGNWHLAASIIFLN